MLVNDSENQTVRAQTNLDFSFAMLIFIIFMTGTVMLPSSPLFLFEHSEIDHSEEAEHLLHEIKLEMISDESGDIDTELLIEFVEDDDFEQYTSSDNIKGNISFEPTGNTSTHPNVFGDNNRLSSGSDIPNTEITTKTSTIYVDGIEVQMKISLWTHPK